MVAERPTLEDLQAEDAGVTRYVAGFLFENNQVALIRKLRPAWQKGRLNGIGGHIEQGESPEAAIVREFEEETGYKTSITQWWPFCVLSGKDWVVHFFSSYGKLDELKSTTDEEVVVLPVGQVSVVNAIPNLTWLIPMAKTIVHESVGSFDIREV